MFGLGYQEPLLILVIALVFFGGSELPDLAKSLGSSMKDLQLLPVSDECGLGTLPTLRDDRGATPTPPK
jgi:mttA/Hcf106 family protein